MTVKDLLSMDVDIDVYNDYDDFGIAFCGPMGLTEDGKKQFGKALDLSMTLRGGGDIVAIVHADNDEEAEAASDLFYALAGFCSYRDYDRWFIEEA